jgi:uncharacterized lipoprotein
MCREMPIVRRWLAVMLVALLPACALTEDHIEPRFTQTIGAPQLPGASAVSVQVTPRDDRNTNRHRVSVKKNGYGMEMASIVATNDVVAEVGGIVAATLRNMGFGTDRATDGTVTVDLHKLWSDFKIGFWSGEAVAELSATVTVRDSTNRVVYSRIHNVEGSQPQVMLMGGENARLAIVQSFDRFAQRIQADGEFSQALLDLARNRPSESPPPRSPRSQQPVS